MLPEHVLEALARERRCDCGLPAAAFFGCACVFMLTFCRKNWTCLNFLWAAGTLLLLSCWDLVVAAQKVCENGALAGETQAAGHGDTHCAGSCRERALAKRTSSGGEGLAAHSLEPAGEARPKKRPRRTRRQAGPVVVEVLGSSGMARPSGAALALLHGLCFAALAVGWKGLTGMPCNYGQAHVCAAQARPWTLPGSAWLGWHGRRRCLRPSLLQACAFLLQRASSRALSCHA